MGFRATLNFRNHDCSINWYRVLKMTHQNLSLAMFWKLFWATLVVSGIEIMVNIGMQSSSDLGGGGCCGDPLAWKIYVMPECMRVEIGMQTHSNCMKNKNVHNSHIQWFQKYFHSKLAYSINQSYHNPSTVSIQVKSKTFLFVYNFNFGVPN